MIARIAALFKPNAKQAALTKREIEQRLRSQGLSRSAAKKVAAEVFAEKGRK